MKRPDTVYVTEHDLATPDGAGTVEYRDRLLKVREFCDRAQLSERHVRRLIAEGRLAVVRLHGVRAIRIREAELTAMIGSVGR